MLTDLSEHRVREIWRWIRREMHRNPPELAAPRKSNVIPFPPERVQREAMYHTNYYRERL